MPEISKELFDKLRNESAEISKKSFENSPVLVPGNHNLDRYNNPANPYILGEDPKYIEAEYLSNEPFYLQPYSKYNKNADSNISITIFFVGLLFIYLIALKITNNINFKEVNNADK